MNKDFLKTMHRKGILRDEEFEMERRGVCYYKRKVAPRGGDTHSNSSSGIGSMSGECACSAQQCSRPPAPLVIEDVEIPVWVGGCEKWLTGLTKRTTCDDVLYALLSHDAPHPSLDLTAYAVHERWRGVERPLSGRTKIMKVWRTWGSEARNVKLYLRKVENILDTSSEVSHTRRPRKRSSRDPKSCMAFPKDARKSDHSRSRTSKHRQEGPQGYKHESTKAVSRSTLSEGNKKQKRSSENLDRPHRESGSGSDSRQQLPKRAVSCDPVSQDMVVPSRKSQGNVMDPHGAKAFHELIHIILGQEKAIQQQMDAIKETDGQIQSFESKAKQHEREAKLNGAENQTGEGIFPAIKEQDLEAYLHICDSILELQDKISNEQEKIDDMSEYVSKEQNAVAESIQAADQEQSDQSGSPLHEELDMIRTDVERSLSLSLAQQEQLQLVSDTLGDCERQLRRKRQYLESLATHLNEGSSNETSVILENNAVQGNVDYDQSVQLESASNSKQHPVSPTEYAEFSKSDTDESDRTAEANQQVHTASGSYASDAPVSSASNQNGSYVQNTVPVNQTDFPYCDSDSNASGSLSTQEIDYAVECENIEVISDDSERPRGILKSRPPGYSVRFADEVEDGDYVNYDPCLTQVYEYSKYDSHDYENIDELDQGYDDYVNEPYEYDNEDEGQWEEPLCQVKTSVTQNVDTGEVYVDTSCEVDGGMVPYYTYQSYGGNCDVTSGKMNSSDDSNSDTGLSSMHSDDAAGAVLETLV